MPAFSHMRTRNGIYYDLTESCYRFRTESLTFVFSSDFYLLKFEETYKQHRKEVSLKLSARFNVQFKASQLADLMLYKKIEKRGFYVLNKRGEPLCQEKIVIKGEQALIETLNEH